MLRLQHLAGNRAVARSLAQSTPDAAARPVQRVVELEEVPIVGDPQFHARAARRNRHWAANPPSPGWPYTEELRGLWEAGDVDGFAEAVRDYQVDAMGIAVDDADGILGRGTAAALQAAPGGRASDRTPVGATDGGATADGANAGGQPGEPRLDPRLAELGEVPDELMATATGTERPVHEAVYEEAMAGGGIGIDGVASTWAEFLAQMRGMDFLGRRVVGHQAFLERLDRAQRWLRANHPELPERGLVTSVNRPGARSQWRAGESTASPHVFGMALDINPGANPWLANPQAREGNTSYAWTAWRAAWLLGRGTAVTPSESHRRAGRRSPATSRGEAQSTEEIWGYLDEASRTSVDYLALDGDREAVAAHLRTLGDPPPPIEGERYIGEYIPADQPVERLRLGEAALDDWMTVLRHDRERWPRNRRNRETGEDEPQGFMNLDLQLVIALRDHGGLQWGACDLGASQSGDMMHFALDPPAFFRFREQVRRALAAAARGGR